MDKSLAYWVEKLAGAIIGVTALIVVFLYWDKFRFISEDDFFDKLITICTTLFGFLLTVLTLIVQSSSETIIKMKVHGSYKRLILYNKTIVVLSAIVCFFSLLLYFLNAGLDGLGENYIKVPSSFNFMLFIWVIIDTLIFVLLFYRILLSDFSK